MTGLEAFLAGERPDDVAVFLADGHLRNASALEGHADRVEGGYVLVVDGPSARRLFPTVAGADPMDFARSAGRREGAVDRDLAGATPRAPSAGCRGPRPPVRPRLRPGAGRGGGGPYEAGDVIHAYDQRACGTAFSDRWVVGERDPGAD